MGEEIINKYQIIFDDLGYVAGFIALSDDTDLYDYEGQMANFPDVCEGWFKFRNGTFEEDSVRKAEILEERRKQAMKPTDSDRLEAQLMYTALMTDTLLPEEEEDE